MDKKDLFDKARSKYGIDAQVQMCIEEMSELTKELCKWFRDKGDINHISEEIADVEIMLEQMKQFFNLQDDVERYKTFKLGRLEERLKEDGIKVKMHKSDYGNYWIVEREDEQ